MAGRRWTEAEADLLGDLYGKLSTDDIAARLGRTVASVRNRGARLHLGRNRPPDVYSLNDLQRMLGLDSHRQFQRWVQRWRLGHADGLRAIRSPRYGRETHSEWWIREADLIRFLRANEHVVDRDRVEPPWQNYLSERWMTFTEAFRRGAAHPFFLDAAVKAGLIPEARQRGAKGSVWVIPESALPGLVAARRRMTTDVDHRLLVLRYTQDEHSAAVKRQRTLATRYARATAAGGRSGRWVNEVQPDRRSA